MVDSKIITYGSACRSAPELSVAVSRRPVPGSFAIPCLKGMPGEPPVPLFVCHANCCRSVMADYLYRHLTGTAAHSAGVEVGEQINDRAAAMLSCWGVDARGHRPRRLDRALCDEAGVILAMGPLYLARLLLRFGRDLASKSYLFADPFVVPPGFEEQAFLVYDPSYDRRAPEELVREFEWFRRRVTEVNGALVSGRPAMVPASRYLDRLDALMDVMQQLNLVAELRPHPFKHHRHRLQIRPGVHVRLDR